MFKSFMKGGEVGYSCQTWLARQANEFIYGNSYYCWFSTELNPIKNGDSSNPSSLYVTLDRAVKNNDTNHAKIRDVQTNLMRGLAKWLRGQGRNTEATNIIKLIRVANMDLFRPQLWRIDLTKVERSRYAGTYQYPDEYLMRDLKSYEFETIVE